MRTTSRAIRDPPQKWPKESVGGEREVRRRSERSGITAYDAAAHLVVKQRTNSYQQKLGYRQ